MKKIIRCVIINALHVKFIETKGGTIMIRNFSSYLPTAKEYECVFYKLRDVNKFNVTHPGVLDSMWAKLIEEGSGTEFGEFCRCLEKTDQLYIQTAKDSTKAKKKEFRMELRLYDNRKTACVKISNLPIW